MKNIKIIYLLSILIGLSIQMKAQSNQGFTIKGQFKGLPDATKMYLTTQEGDTICKSISQGDHFVFSGKLELEGRFHFIIMDTIISKIRSKAILLVNQPLLITGNLGKEDVIVSGSPAHLDYNYLRNEFSKIKAVQKKLADTLMLLSEKGKLAIDTGNSEALMEHQRQTDEYWKKFDVLTRKQNQTGLTWVKTHPNSLYAPYVIKGYKDILELEEIQKIYNQLTQKAKNSFYGVELKGILSISKLSFLIRSGAIIPEISIVSSEGKSMSILKIASENKLTLIDCWASWCTPCRAEIPALKEIYMKYKDKGFNILGISSDKNERAWKKALLEDDTPWMHGRGIEGRTVTALFDLKAIPAYILIDSQGKLIAFDCAMSGIPSFGGGLRGENLDKKLTELIGE